MDLQHFARDLVDALGDRPAMFGAEGEGAEDEQVERALRKVDALAVMFPFYFDKTLLRVL